MFFEEGIGSWQSGGDEVKAYPGDTKMDQNFRVYEEGMGRLGKYRHKRFRSIDGGRFEGARKIAFRL